MPIIYLTTYLEYPASEKHSTDGPAGYVSKPFDLSDLENAIQKVLAAEGLF